MNDLPEGAAVPVAPPELRRRSYVPAIGPRLRALLYVVFVGFALLGATGAYLSAIRLLEWWRQATYTNQFTISIFLAHNVVGVLFLLPFFVFGGIHLITARNRPNRVAVRRGIALFVAGLVIVFTGIALMQLEGLPQLSTETLARKITLTLHIVVPVLSVGLYIAHRHAGPVIKWKYGYAWGGATGAFILGMALFHVQHPQAWFREGPKEGERYFFPSEARTADGKFISARTLMNDEYCLKCHPDTYKQWFHSAHHFSSFNNPPYLFSVRETREASLKRDGNVRASRWCAGCHDPVPFFSGAFDDPKFDDVNHPTAHAGITCTVCHAITNINSPIGNGAYTIAEPENYPFTYSTNPILQWINNQLVKAKPDFHKRMMLKPFHKTAEFCSTCHKVHLPLPLNHYQEFTRGQNHYDSYLLSGVSGHGARSFYYPPQAKQNCAECHMPPLPSHDFGAKFRDGQLTIRDHTFPAANTGLFALLAQTDRYRDHAPGFDATIKKNTDFLRGTDPSGKDQKVRIDLFGLKRGGTIDGELVQLRPQLPELTPGQTYLVEVVIRTVNLGHPFSQGTVDSNEIWVDFQASSGGQTFARSGGMSKPNDDGEVGPWAHFVNVLLLDRDGKRINRRNPQDIFTTLYNHQIPPGAAQVVHYRLKVPAGVAGPVELKVRLRYRKFDYEYMKLVHKDQPVPRLPVVDMCEDHVILPVVGRGAAPQDQASPIKPAWQRWNDYGIACLIEGGPEAKKGELRQAEQAFRHLLTLNEKAAVPNAHINLARAFLKEGRLSEAAKELEAARTSDPPAPWWVLAWFSGQVDFQNATSKEDLDRAIQEFERILDPKNQPRERGFDFSRDYLVRTRLAQALFSRAQNEGEEAGKQRPFLLQAVREYNAVLDEDPENLAAHYGLYQCYNRLDRGSEPPLPPSPQPDVNGMLAEARTLADRKSDSAARASAAAALVRDLDGYAQQPSRPDQPKLPVVRQLLAVLRHSFADEPDPTVQDALARALGHLHRDAHAIYKPDELAQASVAERYRKDHPAANLAAEAIVIYPTERAGAPGR